MLCSSNIFQLLSQSQTSTFHSMKINEFYSIILHCRTRNTTQALHTLNISFLYSMYCFEFECIIRHFLFCHKYIYTVKLITFGKYVNLNKNLINLLENSFRFMNSLLWLLRAKWLGNLAFKVDFLAKIKTAV